VAGGAAAGTILPGLNGSAVPAAPPGLDPAATMDARAAATAFPPVTRPLTTARPLPDDLSDVLTPVQYRRGGTTKRKAGAVAGTAAGTPPAAGAVADGAGTATRNRWHSVLVFATVLAVAGVSVVLPVAGTLAALALFAMLRTAGLVQRRSAARRVARGTRRTDPLVTVVSLPWFLIRALAALVLLAPLALATAAIVAGIAVTVSPAAWPYRALAYAAGALVIFYGLGPGSGMPRAQLRRVYSTVTRTPAARVLVLAGMAAVAAVAVAAAVTSPAAYWPTAVPPALVRFGEAHIGLFRHLDYRFGVAHHIHMIRGYLLRHLDQLGSAS